jgi:hypothetical protein
MVNTAEVLATAEIFVGLVFFAMLGGFADRTGADFFVA